MQLLQTFLLKNFLHLVFKESSNVTGNFTVETSGKWYMIGNTSDGINYADITLNVGGDFYINNSIVAVGHNGDSTTPSVAALNVNGDLYISGTGSVLHLASIGDHGHYSTAAGSLNLQGTMYIGSGARLGNAGSNVTSSFFINNLENSGHVFLKVRPQELSITLPRTQVYSNKTQI